jgi:hypothetical protein
MTPQQFIAKSQRVTLSERSAWPTIPRTDWSSGRENPARLRPAAAENGSLAVLLPCRNHRRFFSW